jgi:hypothetical protein
MTGLSLVINGKDELVEIGGLIIAGWAGRDRRAVQAHIAELERLGISPPSETPVFYRISASRLTTASFIEVMGVESSGEAEFVLLMLHGQLYVGIGSDHTDRKAEAIGITLSKQVCDKPLGRTWWKYGDVAPHWDSLRLRSYGTVAGRREKYQEGSVAELLTPNALLEKLGHPLAEGYVMFCGTIPAMGGVKTAEDFEIELVDPVLQRSLYHRYRSVALPVTA